MTSWLRDDINAFLLHKVQELQGRAGRALLSHFPFLNGRNARIQQRGEYSLADV